LVEEEVVEEVEEKSERETKRNRNPSIKRHG
jgi:hypothetical protein